MKNNIYSLTLRALSFLSLWRVNQSSLTKNDYKKAKLGTILAFITAGMATAPWASVIPFVKMRLSLNDIEYASIILCFGLGAVIGMPATGKLVTKVGVKKVILVATIALYSSMALLSINSITLYLAYTSTFFWGVSIGILDVASNIHAALLEKLSGKHLMSRFHGCFNLGCIAAAIFYASMLYAGFHTFTVALLVALTGFILVFFFYPLLINTKGEYEEKLDLNTDDGTNKFKIRPILLIIGTIALIMYLTEGMVYDWSAVYLIERSSIAIEIASIGYLAFESATMLMRFVGDSLVNKFGELLVLLLGSFIGFIAILIIAFSKNSYIMIPTFFIAGMALSNIVPIMFSLAGRCDPIYQGKAISLIGTIGYSGLLLGPGVLGLIANYMGLPFIFIFVSMLIVLMGILSFIALKHKSIKKD